MMLRVDIDSSPAKSPNGMPPPKVMLSAIAAVAFSGCATADLPADLSKAALDDSKPFIKLLTGRNRDVALMIHATPALNETEQDVLLSTLADRLAEIYQTAIIATLQPGIFSRFEPSRLAEFALSGTDDVIVLELTEQPGDPLMGRIRVINLALRRAIVDVKLPPQELASGPERARHIADATAKGLSREWTDPGAYDPMVPLAIADHLASIEACEDAVKVYSRIIRPGDPLPFTKIGPYQASLDQYERCRKKVRIARQAAADAKATYSLSIDAEGMSPRIAAAMQDALQTSRLREVVGRWTKKPALVCARPEILSIELRLDTEQYRAAVAHLPRYRQSLPVLHVSPFVELMEALVDFRTATLSRLPPYFEEALLRPQTQLRFRALPEDHVVLTFNKTGGRLLIDDELIVKVGARTEVAVEALNRRVSRSQMMVLGPPEDATGQVTDYGLVYRFFGLDT